MEFIEILKTIGIFIGALMILVFIHELGHFLAAKLFGMRVERFSVGFPPRIWGFQKGDTDYCIGATPLGGYVKITGMIDESMDTEFIDKEPEPWEYRSKPVWQRMIVITAGVIFNMILAFFIFTGMNMSNGKLTLPLSEVEGIFVPEESLLYELGFRTDDKITGVNGKEVTAFEELVKPSELTSGSLSYQIIRDGERTSVSIPSGFLDSLQTRDFLSASYTWPGLISRVAPASPAEEAGLQAGDEIVMIDSVKIDYWLKLTDIISSADTSLTFVINRNGEQIVRTIMPDPETNQVGIGPPTLEMIGGRRVDLGLIASVSEGWDQTWEQTAGIIGGFSRMISGDISVRQNLGGPIAIANITRQATDQSGWTGFWQITALLSITLAIMNILPIPALDGGHLVFLIYEGIVGKEPSEKFRIAAQNVGFIILLTLMVFVIFNDVLKYF